MTCCGDDLGPWGEKAACAAEKGVDTGGVPTAPCCDCEGVLPCCDSACFIGVGVAISSHWSGDGTKVVFTGGEWTESRSQP